MSYMREAERYDNGLPSIRRSGLVDSSIRRDIRQWPDADDRYGRIPVSGSFNDPVFYPRTLSPRAQHTELQDQLKLLKDELNKKDRLISQLSTLETPRANKLYDSSQIDDLYSADRIAATATAKSEVAALKVKVEGLQSQVREFQGQLDLRENKIRELKRDLEISKENECKQNALVSTLRGRVSEYEAQLGSFDSSVQRSEVAVSSLQRELKEKSERVFELEAKLRSFQEERDQAEHGRAMLERRFNDFFAQLANTVSVGSNVSLHTTDSVLARVIETAQDNAMLRGKLATMKECLMNAELESKASRETIMRLVTEAERDQKMVGKYNVEFDSMRAERDQAILRQRELEREISLQRDRVEASERAWSVTRAELEDRHMHFSQQDGRVRELDSQLRNLDQTHRSFKEQLAGLLTDAYHNVEPYEEQIRERITSLMRGNTDKRSHIDMLENKISNLTDQLQNQCQLQQEADHRARQAEVDVRRLDDQLRRMEGELSASMALCDGTRVDKERYLRFLEQVSVALKIDPIHADVGLDNATDTILARIAQLVGKENQEMVEKKTHVYNLQRKVKSLKDQLDNKDLHMDLLRKKVVSLEERVAGRSDLDREKDEEFVKNRKLLKLVEKYKRELNECRLEIRDLKARLLESTEYRNQTLEQRKHLEDLEAKVGQLETIRTKQADKIQGLKSELDERVSQLSEKRDTAHHTVHQLSSELKTTKQALLEITQRERQLLDLRQVIARMLGLDVNSLAVPDYEIISRLEKLILANQSNAATVVAFDTALSDMEDGFRTGYDMVSRSIGTRASRTALRGVRTAPHPAVLKGRTRSLSPRRKIDPRAY